MKSQQEKRSSRARRGRPVGRFAALSLVLVASVLVAGRIAPPAAADPVPSRVYVVRSATDEVVPVTPVGLTPDPPIAVGDDPRDLVVSPDGSTAYVTNAGSGTVSVVDLRTRTVTATIPVGAEPDGIAMTPDGSKVVVANRGSRSVSIISTATNSTSPALASILVGPGPDSIAITPDGFTAYVTLTDLDAVVPVSLTSGQPGLPIAVGDGPRGIAVLPNGSGLYVVNELSGTVTAIALPSGQPGPTPIVVGGPAAAPVDIAITPPPSCNTDPCPNTPDVLRAFVTLAGTSALATIELATNSVTSRSLPNPPERVAVAPDGATAYVSSPVGEALLAVPTAGGPIATQLGLAGATGVAVTPDQPAVAALSVTSTSSAPCPGGATPTPTFVCIPVNATFTLDASASQPVMGTIVKYLWNFGDGSPVVATTTPTITHTYTSAGNYSPGVAIEDSAGTRYTRVFTGQMLQRNGNESAIAYAAVAVVGPAVPAGAPTVYVATSASDQVTPVDVSATSLVPGSPVAAGDYPAYLAMDPSGRAIVTANFEGDRVSLTTACPVDGTLRLTPAGSQPTGDAPVSVAVSPVPSGQTQAGTTYPVYVTSSGSNEVRVYVLTVSQTSCAATLTTPASSSISSSVIPIAGSPWGIAITPDGTRAYVANAGHGVVTPIDLATGRAGLPIPVGRTPHRVAVSPDGAVVYVVDSGSGTVTPITTATNRAGPAIRVGALPEDIAISPDGRKAYVTGAEPLNGPGRLTVVDLATQSVDTQIVLPAPATGVAMDPSGSAVYVTSLAAGTLTRVPTATNVPDAPVAGFAGALGVVAAPDQAARADLVLSAPAPVTCPQQAPAGWASVCTSTGVPVTFDASASVAVTGTIASYTWVFGDGSPNQTTTTPTITHTYTQAGTYQAGLLVTTSAGTTFVAVYTGQTMLRNGNFATAVRWGAVQIVEPIPSGLPLAYVASASANQIVPLALRPSQAPQPGAPIGTAALPTFMTVDPSGRALVIANYEAGTVSLITACPSGPTVTFTAAGSQPTGARPVSVAISPVPVSQTATERVHAVYVTNSGANEVRRYNLAISLTQCQATLSTPTPISSSIIPIGGEPYGIAITADGRTAYVSNAGHNTVTPIDLTTQSPGLPILVGSTPRGVALHGNTLLVVNHGSNSVTPINTTTNQPGAPIAVGTSPQQIVITPDGTRAYVTSQGSNQLSVIDVPGRTALAPISLPVAPLGIALASNGTRALVTGQQANALVDVDLVTGTVSNVLGGFSGAIGVATSPAPQQP